MPRRSLFKQNTWKFCSTTYAPRRLSIGLPGGRGCSCSDTKVSNPATYPRRSAADGIRSGGSRSATEPRAWKPFKIGQGRVGRAFFPSVERAQVVALACRKPEELGLPLSRWTVRSLASRLVEDGTITQIHYSSVSLILQNADLHPHRILYWKRSHDPDFVPKATHVLWYYEHVESLFERGELVFCLDEKPGIQLLGRPLPDLPMEPGTPLRREYEYVRRGTGLLLMIYDLNDGLIFTRTPEAKNSTTLTHILDQHIKRYPSAKRIHYIMDNDGTHTSNHTQNWLKSHEGRVRFHFTPTGASWLDQAELALSSFSRLYLRNRIWSSIDEFPRHVKDSTRHYNRNRAHRFNWSFTRDRFREWLQSSKTCSTGH